MCKSGVIPHIKSGRWHMINPEQADEALKALAANVQPATAAKKKPRPKKAHVPNVAAVKKYGFVNSLNSLMEGKNVT